MADSPMRPILLRGRVFWAGARFERPGLYIWMWNRNIRVLPWPRMLTS